LNLYSYVTCGLASVKLLDPLEWVWPFGRDLVGRRNVGVSLSSKEIYGRGAVLSAPWSIWY